MLILSLVHSLSCAAGSRTARNKGPSHPAGRHHHSVGQQTLYKVRPMMKQRELRTPQQRWDPTTTGCPFCKGRARRHVPLARKKVPGSGIVDICRVSHIREFRHRSPVLSLPGVSRPRHRSRARVFTALKDSARLSSCDLLEWRNVSLANYTSADTGYARPGTLTTHARGVERTDKDQNKCIRNSPSSNSRRRGVRIS